MRAEFLMAIHFHQPVGNFDHVIEGICDRCYVPFINTVKEYPEIKMSFHFSGVLMEWMENNRPEILESVREMVESGQIEMISGAFYEPILSSIPARDGAAQISMMNEFIRNKFSVESSGAWVAERVWEPNLPSLYSDAGIKYVILDESHFSHAGIEKLKTYGYYTTEHEGKSVAVFPSDKTLRYGIPFRTPSECIEYMRSVAASVDNPTFVYGDDGEKFGEWPGTNHLVYGEGWLKRFFDELMAAGDWLKTMTFSECLKAKRPIGQIYLPSCSYDEMLEWALPAEAQERYEDVVREIEANGMASRCMPYMRGGYWGNFLTKYPEVGHMHKKMLYLSDKLNNLRKKGGKKKILDEASRELYRGQCNCAYWHGVFGGLYLFHLRRAVYHHLIKSEKYMDEAVHGNREFCEVVCQDFDADGLSEVILENKECSLYFDPADGGVLKELDSKGGCYNLMNTLARRREAYHRTIIKKIKEGGAKTLEECKKVQDAIQVGDPDIKDHLIYDRQGRHSLIDHFIKEEVGIKVFSADAYREEGDFVGAAYTFDTTESPEQVSLIMERDGVVSASRVRVKKEVILSKKGSDVIVNYTITNKESKPLDIMFAPELNITMPDADSPEYSVVFSDATVFGLKEKVAADMITTAKVMDRNKASHFEITMSEACRLWHFPIETVSQSETAYELNYQCSAFILSWPLKLLPGEEQTFRIELKSMTSDRS